MSADWMRALAVRVAPAAVVLLGWEAFARLSGSFLFPTVPATVGVLVHLLGSADLWRAIWISNQALIIGLPIAWLVGVPLGFAVGRFPALDRWLGVHINLLLVTPKSAIMPLIVIAFGFGLLTRAVIVAAFALPVIVVTVRSGVIGAAPRLMDMARTFGASEAQLWRHVILPGARPALASALRLGVTRAVAGMISVELLLVAVGLGGLILNYQADFDAAAVYALVVVVLAEAVVLAGLAARVERRFGSATVGVPLE